MVWKEVYYNINKTEWMFDLEELTSAERERICDTFNLYTAVKHITNDNFYMAYNFLSKIYTSLGAQIAANIRSMLEHKLENMDLVTLTKIILQNLKVDFSSPNNQKILNNECARETIKLITMSGLPIEYDYFESLPYINEDLLVIFKNMQQYGRLNDSNTKNLFKICDAMQLSSTATRMESHEDIINTADFPEDIKQALLAMISQTTRMNTVSLNA